MCYDVILIFKTVIQMDPYICMYDHRTMQCDTFVYLYSSYLVSRCSYKLSDCGIAAVFLLQYMTLLCYHIYDRHPNGSLYLYVCSQGFVSAAAWVAMRRLPQRINHFAAI